MLSDRYTHPAVQVGYMSAADGGMTVAGQEYSGAPQTGQYRAAQNGSAIAVKVGRKPVVVGVGGIYAPRTTH